MHCNEENSELPRILPYAMHHKEIPPWRQRRWEKKYTSHHCLVQVLAVSFKIIKEQKENKETEITDTNFTLQSQNASIPNQGHLAHQNIDKY